MKRVGHIFKSIALAVALGHLAGCEGLQGGNPLGLLTEPEFPGVQNIRSLPDGSYVVEWDAPPSERIDPTYSVYMRQGALDYNFNKPLVETKERSYTTADLKFAPETCFVVRYSTADYRKDENRNEKCIPGWEYQFPGISSVVRQEDGKYVLSWEAAPIKNVRYQIFESVPEEGVASAPFREVSEISASVGPFSFNEIKCFTVRMVAEGRTSVDSNSVAKCTDDNVINGFVGVDTAKSEATGAVTVTWTPADRVDVIGYVIYKNGFKETLETVKGRANSSVTIVGRLAPSDQVTIGVRAISESGYEDKNTREIPVVIKDLRPPTFGGIKVATLQANGDANISWIKNDEASVYHVFVSKGAAGGNPAIDWSTPTQVVPATQGTYVHQALGDDFTYNFAVRMVNKFGVEDVNTNTLSVQVPDKGAPVFEGLQTVEQLEDGKIKLTWKTPVGQVSFFRIFRAQGSSGAVDLTSTSIPQEPGTSTFAILGGFKQNLDYSFLVRAVDSHGQSDGNVNFVTLKPTKQTLPEFSGYVGVEGVNETQVKVKFNVTTSEDIRTYKIRTRLASTKSQVRVDTLSQDLTKSVLEPVISGLTAKTNYEFLVTAIDVWGNESTNEVYLPGATLDLTPPNFGGIISVNQVGAMLEATWAPRPNTDIDHYRLYWSTTNLASSSFTAPLTESGALPDGVFRSGFIAGTDTARQVTGLAKGVTYYFVVHAIDANGNEDTNRTTVAAVVANTFPSMTSDAVSRETFEGVPMAAITLTATDDDTSDSLTFTQVSTNCPADSLPTRSDGLKIGKSRPTTIYWTPASGFILSGNNQRTCSVTYRVSDGFSDSPSITFMLTAKNRAPKNVVTTVTTPVGGANRYQNLSCAATASDDDGNFLTFQYAWKKNGTAIAGATSATLTPAQGQFLPNDSVVCVGTANDDHENTSAESTAVAFTNTAPANFAATVAEDATPVPLKVGDKIACSYSATDVDDDPLTFGTVSVESSSDGTSWSSTSLTPVACATVQSNKTCFTVTSSVRRSYLRCKVASVTDGFAPVNVAATSPSILVENSDPVMSAVDISPNTGLEQNSLLSCNPVVTDVDEDAISAPSYQWLKDGSAIPGATQKTYTITANDRSNAIRCQATYGANADGAGSSVVGPMTSAAVYYYNSAPVVTSVTITPASGVYTGTQLTCNHTATDPEGDTVTGASYKWLLDNVEIANANSQTYTVIASQRTKSIKCAVTLPANADGHNSSEVGPVNSSNAVIPANSNPQIVSVTLSPTTDVKTGTALTCAVVATDLDSDTLGNPQYSWQRNGTNISGQANSTYMVQASDRGKNITCRATLPANNDGKGSTIVGPVLSSNHATPGNSNPVISVVSIVSESGNTLIYPGEKLSCTGNVSDPDGDDVFKSYKWFRGGVEISGAIAYEYITVSQDRTQNVTCEIIAPTNADANGSTATSRASSNFFTPANRDPNGSFAVFVTSNESNYYLSSTLTCAGTTTDPDGDVMLYTYKWKKGASYIAGATSSELTPAEHTALPNQVLKCEVTASDGYTSVTSSSANLTVVNREPVFTQLPSISPATIYSSLDETNGTQTLTCGNFIVTDADDPTGSTLTYKYRWGRKNVSGGASFTNFGISTPVVSNTLTADSLANRTWSYGTFVACQVTVNDGYVDVVSHNDLTQIGSNHTSSRIVSNIVPHGTLVCGPAPTTRILYPNDSLDTMANPMTCSGINDPDANGLVYVKHTASTCDSNVVVNQDGTITGTMPSASCSVVVRAMDDTLSEATTAFNNGVVAEATVNFSVPFAAYILDPVVDSSCKVRFPTKFTASGTGFGSATLSFSNLVTNGTAVKQDPDGNGDGYLEGNLSLATGFLETTWNIIGANPSFTKSIVSTVNITDLPAPGDVPLNPLRTVGMQTLPRLNSAGDTALACGTTTCTGTPGGIAMGPNHSCSINTLGELFCWGDNSNGELGRGTVGSSFYSPAAASLGTLGVSQVAAGGATTLAAAHTCAVVYDTANGNADAGVRCWGNNAYGQLGINSEYVSPNVGEGNPVTPIGLTSGVFAVSAGGAHTCALLSYSNESSGGGLKCWGYNGNGQLGIGSTQSALAPASVENFSTAGAKGISAGGSHTCAISNIGSLFCWGQNNDGQLGLANYTQKLSPTQIPSFGNIVAVAAGDRHTCVIRSDGTVWCWGSNSHGQLGTNSFLPAVNVPVQVSGITNAVSISAGNRHTCAMLSNGGAKCWGYNVQGQLGLGYKLDEMKRTPQDVVQLSYRGLAVEAGDSHTCILKNNGEVACFGSLAFGQTGLQVQQYGPTNFAVNNQRFKACPALRASP